MSCESHIFASSAAGFRLGAGVNVPALGGRVHPNPAGSVAEAAPGLSSPLFILSRLELHLLAPHPGLRQIMRREKRLPWV